MSDDLQAEIDNLRRTLETQRTHASQAIQEKEMNNKLLREQFEQSQIKELTGNLAADVNLTDPNWAQPFSNLFPGPDTRKESTSMSNPNEIVMTQSELAKQMKQTARDAIKEYEAAKVASQQKESQTLKELNDKFMAEHPEMVPHAPYLNDVYTTLQNAPKDPQALYEYTLAVSKRNMEYAQQLAQQQQAAQQTQHRQPTNPYSTAGLGSPGSMQMPGVDRYGANGNQPVAPGTIFDGRGEEMRLNDAAAEARQRRSAYLQQGVGK